MNLISIRVTVAVATLVMLVGVGLAAPSAAATTNAPSGMHRFVASIGWVDPGVHTNWVRLASYSFNIRTKCGSRTGTGVSGFVYCVPTLGCGPPAA